MKHSLKSTLAPIALAAMTVMVGGPSMAQTVPALKIHTAVEVEYETEIGKSYTLQGALDLTHWIDIGHPVLGHGRAVSQIFSTKNRESVNYASYRLVVSNGPTNGFAPWSIAGARVQMDEGATGNVVEYLSDTSGRDNYSGSFDLFTYQFTRLSENNARVDRTFGPDRRESLTYSYTSPGIGTWLREEYRQGSLERRVLGIFRYSVDTANTVPGVTNTPVTIVSALPPSPPTTLNGLVYYVLSGSKPDQLAFKTESSGVETPSPSLGGEENENEVSPGGNTFTYTYKVLGSNSVSLIINYGYYGFGGDKNEYDLTYTDGPSGTFVRRIYRLGSLYSTDSGAFSPFLQPVIPISPGGTNSPTTFTGPPPAQPVGFTYTMHSGLTPERLVFSTALDGTEFDDSAPSGFTYTYTVSNVNQVSLIVRFKADKWDEYELTFTGGAGGTFVRREYDKNKLKDTDAAAFNIAPTN